MRHIADIEQELLDAYFRSFEMKAEENTGDSCTYCRQEDDIDILDTGVAKSHSSSSRGMGIQYFSRLSYQLWSMRSGFVSFKVEEEDSIASACARAIENMDRLMYENYYLIVNSCTEGDMVCKEESYTCHPLGQNNQKVIYDMHAEASK